jgi:hypothetical protein
MNIELERIRNWIEQGNNREERDNKGIVQFSLTCSMNQLQALYIGCTNDRMQKEIVVNLWRY